MTAPRFDSLSSSATQEEQRMQARQDLQVSSSSTTTTTRNNKRSINTSKRSLTALLFMLASSARADNTLSPLWERYDFTPPRQECSIYMAPTSLPGGGGFGVYTTRDIRKGDPILAAPDGPSVPMWDPNLSGSAQLQTFRHTYWWSNGAGDFNLLTGWDVVDNQNTLGALPNHHCMLATINVRLPEVEYDDSMANRFQDPGAGAFSYGKGREFYIDERSVEAGEELFLSYVPCEEHLYVDVNTDNFDWIKEIPLTQHFQQAASLVRRAWKDLHDHALETQEIDWPPNTDKFVANLLPETFGELEELWTKAKSTKSSELARQVARNALTERSVDWIKEEGMCLENLVPLPSIIPQAGTGGVAQFDLSRGEIIVPAPLLHLDREAVKMYDNKGNLVGTQLLMNYCLGHEESDILLYPDTNAIMVNHCSNRGSFAKYCPDGPNAAFTWSSGWDPTSEEWRHMTVEEIMERTSRGLSMEIVALRDIQAGEEVFIDYGAAWEAAWEDHVANWTPPDRVESWLTAKEANDLEEIVPELMSGDLRKFSEHPHLFTACRYQVSEEDYHEDFLTPPVKNWQNLTDDEIFELFADSGESYEGVDYRDHEDRSHWPCTVLFEDEEEEGSYVVRIHQAWWWRGDPLPWDENELPRVLERYPREAIHFFVLPYETDQQMANAFRHPMGIPDEIFPEHWKNAPQSRAQTSSIM